MVSFDQLELRTDLSYSEEPIQILDRKEKVLRNRSMSLVRVLWRNHSVEESTWEMEAEMKEKYPALFL